MSEAVSNERVCRYEMAGPTPNIDVHSLCVSEAVVLAPTSRRATVRFYYAALSRFTHTQIAAQLVEWRPDRPERPAAGEEEARPRRRREFVRPGAEAQSLGREQQQQRGGHGVQQRQR